MSTYSKVHGQVGPIWVFATNLVIVDIPYSSKSPPVRMHKRLVQYFLPNVSTCDRSRMSAKGITNFLST